MSSQHKSSQESDPVKRETSGVLTKRNRIRSLSQESYHMSVINVLEAKRLSYTSIYTEEVLGNNIILIIKLVGQDLQGAIFKIK